MKGKSLILSLVFVFCLVSFNVQAEETLTLSLETILQRGLQNPPSMSQLNMISMDINKPVHGLRDMLLPKVNLQISQSGEAKPVFQTGLQGDLSNYLLITRRIQYQNLADKKYNLEVQEAKQDLYLSLIYPYLQLIENQQNLDIYEYYNQLIEENFAKLREKAMMKSLDSLTYKQAQLIYSRYQLFLENYRRQQPSYMFELLTWMGYQKELPANIELTEDLLQIQESLKLYGDFTEEDLELILANGVTAQISNYDSEIQSLALKIEQFKKAVPDTTYNLSYSYGKDDGCEVTWNVQANWNWEEFLHGSKLELQVSKDTKQLSFDFNQIDSTTGKRLTMKEQATINKNNSLTKNYEVYNRYVPIFNQIEEGKKVLSFSKLNLEFMEEQLKLVQSGPDNEQKWLDLLNLYSEFAQAQASFNGQLRGFLYSQLQLRAALGELNY